MTGRNLRQGRALCGRPSGSAGWDDVTIDFNLTSAETDHTDEVDEVMH